LIKVGAMELHLKKNIDELTTINFLRSEIVQGLLIPLIIMVGRMEHSIQPLQDERINHLQEI